MTPEEWETCTDLRTMLEYLRPSARASDRKLRLFGVACCRNRWHELTDPAGRRAVDVAELQADSKADRRTVAKAKRGVELAVRTAIKVELRGGPPCPIALKQARCITIEEAWYAAALAAPLTEDPELQAVARAFLRDIFIPFWSVHIDPSVLAWNDSAARRLAESIYKGRRFGDLPVLADLLVQAGCTDADLLGHLRGPGPHVLGCWALDTLLGKS
jgi:hypothetical protein